MRGAGLPWLSQLAPTLGEYMRGPRGPPLTGEVVYIRGPIPISGSSLSSNRPGADAKRSFDGVVLIMRGPSLPLRGVEPLILGP